MAFFSYHHFPVGLKMFQLSFLTFFLITNLLMDNFAKGNPIPRHGVQDTFLVKRMFKQNLSIKSYLI